MLLFDFGLEVGERCEIYRFNPFNEYEYKYSSFTVECGGRNTITSNGNVYDVLAVTEDFGNPENAYYVYWVDGVGSLDKLIFTNGIAVYAETNPGLRSYNFYYMYDGDGNLLYNHQDGLIWLSESQAGVSNLIETTVPTQTKYRLDGLPMAEGEKGLYISGGKKYIER